MTFNSVAFIVFMAIVWAAYHAMRGPMQRAWLLLGASYFFYMWWRVDYALLLVIPTVVDYGCGQVIGRSQRPLVRRAALATSVVVNVGLLLSFKYWNFLTESMVSLGACFGVGIEMPVFDVLLPVGISFYTFQALSYTIEVFRGRIQSEPNLIRFALYVSFGTTQSLVLLVTRVLDYQPDVIVVFEGSEALFYATNYEARPGYPFNFSVRERAHARLTGQDPNPFPLLTALMQTETMKRFHPNLLRHALETTLLHQSTTITIDDPTGYDPYIDVVVRDIGRIARIASAYGCATIIAVPPIRADVLAPVALDRLTQRVKHMVEQRGAPGTYSVSMKSTRNELTNGHWWRPDGLHWTDEANRLFADRFAQAIIDAGVLRQSILGRQSRPSRVIRLHHRNPAYDGTTSR